MKVSMQTIAIYNEYLADCNSAIIPSFETLRQRAEKRHDAKMSYQRLKTELHIVLTLRRLLGFYYPLPE